MSMDRVGIMLIKGKIRTIDCIDFPVVNKVNTNQAKGRIEIPINWISAQKSFPDSEGVITSAKNPTFQINALDIKIIKTIVIGVFDLRNAVMITERVMRLEIKSNIITRSYIKLW